MLFYSHLVETQIFQIAFPVDLDLAGNRSKSVLSTGTDVSNQQPFECFCLHSLFTIADLYCVKKTCLGFECFIIVVKMTSNNPSVFLLMVNGQIETASVS